MTRMDRHEMRETGMTRVANRIAINGPIERVFDVVTTTRHWPQWHPATISVGGVTERPIALGDPIRERARIGARVYEGEWTVAEHEYPLRVVLSGRAHQDHLRVRPGGNSNHHLPARAGVSVRGLRGERRGSCGAAELDAPAVRSGAGQAQAARRGTCGDEQRALSPAGSSSPADESNERREKDLGS